MASPTRIGRFEIVRELGRGAMGLVYLAHDPKIDRKVAIKTIQRNPALGDTEADESKQRFLREAQAAGKLIHAGIVTIFDVGEDQGFSYIAMEYIEGSTLETATKPGGLLPIEQVVRMVIQACAALDYAHENRIVHRDVKPANLMVIGGKQLKITDFGLAKNPSANLTSAGTLVGTPNYMSPEQIMGRALDGRSDLFSLGVVLYELLTGDRPFGGDTISTIIYKILHEIPKSPEIVNPRVPAALTQVILKAIDKDPAKRYQSGHEFADALQAYLDSVSPQMLSAQMRSSVVREPAAETVAELPGEGPAAAVAAARAAAAKREAARARPTAEPPQRRSLALPILLVALAGLGIAAAALYPRWAPLLKGGAKAAEPAAEAKATAESAERPAAETGATPGGEPARGGPSVTLPAPLPAGDVASIRVETDPPGGKIFLDGAEVTGGTIVLGKGDGAPHTLVASNACFEDQRAVRSSDPDSVLMRLRTPKLHRIRVNSDPPGARVSLDGHDMPGQTPADLNITACEPHAISARLSGFRDSLRKFAADTVWPSVSPLTLAMEKLPEGSLLVKSPYPVDVLEGGRALGSSGSPVSLSAGRHALSFTNKDLFVDLTADVDVKPGETATPSVAFPGVGQLTVFANPSNGYAMVDGKKIGALPINGFPIAEGRYTVKVVLDTGEVKEKTSLVTSGRTTVEKFLFP
ncbi:MAG: serine/threonine protein kinase [Acidobacteria bacterium]|nr:serine/threonine protein kinase [Acidobacteriota bacterium]